jgi:hypothetical protein
MDKNSGCKSVSKYFQSFKPKRRQSACSFNKSKEETEDTGKQEKNPTGSVVGFHQENQSANQDIGDT